MNDLNLRLELSGPLRKPDGERMVETSCPKGTRVKDLLKRELDYSPRQQRFIRIVQDGNPLNPEDRLESGKPIQVFLRLGGG